MIELAMVKRMAKRGVFVAAAIAVVLFAWQGLFYATSSLVGAALTLVNLWLSARVIGGVAEANPQMLLPVGVATFAGTLIGLTLICAVLSMTDLIYFPATGFTLIGMHLVLVLWEAAGAYAQPKRSGA